jgi:L-2-hydroxyglutarate oxidase
MHDVAIVGGGIVGLATAHALGARAGGSLVVLEAEATVGAHQTGHNSGVIHSGLYYKPGSLKAQNCVTGRDALYRFCAEHDIAHERCGKVVVATDPAELPALAELERRGRANGLTGVRPLGPEALREIEPHVTGLRGLLVPETGIVDYPHVTRTLAALVERAGGDIRTGTRFLACRPNGAGLVLETSRGAVHARHLINCGGLQSDRIARRAGVEPGVHIVPFRGEYYELVPERHHLVRNLIYPVPDARFPFLGVHFTRMVRGGVEAGPNAVLALKREGYRWSDVSAADLADMSRYAGFWRMGLRYWKTAVAEIHRSLSKRAFVDALRKLVPSLAMDDVRPAGSGVRAQAVGPAGLLVDDFHIVEAERMIHVLNAPSPAATAALSIGQTIAAMAAKRFALR